MTCTKKNISGKDIVKWDIGYYNDDLGTSVFATDKDGCEYGVDVNSLKFILSKLDYKVKKDKISNEQILEL